MKPILHTGIFLTLALLASRRAEGKNFITTDRETLQMLNVIFDCCQDNTWDIAVAENAKAPSETTFTVNDRPAEDNGLDLPVEGLDALKNNLIRRPSRRPPFADNPLRIKVPHGLFHPPAFTR